jgi:hypothetical protein
VRRIAESVSRYAPGEQREWPHPTNILRPFTAPPYTRDDVPAIIGRYAEAWARAGGFDPSMPILACTVAAAAMIDDGIRVHAPGETDWYESARLWGAIIGGSATGKSPAIKAAVRPAIEVHRELVHAWDSDPAEDKGPRPALFTSDTTVEALSDRLKGNPRGILILNDELEGLLGQHDAYRGRGGPSKDRGDFMRLYDGGGHQVDRVQRWNRAAEVAEHVRDRTSFKARAKSD